MKLRRALVTVGATASAMLTIGAGTALANTLYVHKPTDTSCGDSSPYYTIQSAVTAANPGDTVAVCPGTYPEQVTIPAGKDNLTLVSVRPLQAVIQAPPTILLSSPKAIVRVNGAHNTRILQFTITGPGPGPCDSLEYGVRVDNGGSADIEQNHITKIEDTPFSGCQNGVAIQVGRDIPTDTTTGSATISGNLIDNYQKNGITIDNSGSSASIDDNVVDGVGPTATIAQNGVQISDGAAAELTGNWISRNIYSPGTYTATGVLLYQPGTAYVYRNYVYSDDTGIYAYQVDQHTTISSNEVSGSTYDGITVDTSTGPRVDGNDSSHNTAPMGEGFGVYTTTGAMLTYNQADDNATNGFYAYSDTSSNTFNRNEAHGNGNYDCRDDSVGSGTDGTANYWINDSGVTSMPMGICRPQQGGYNDPNAGVTAAAAGQQGPLPPWPADTLGDAGADS